MATLENVRLSASGRRRHAVITARGTIVWEGEEYSWNGARMEIHFWGEDSGLRGGDDNRHGFHLRFTRAAPQTVNFMGTQLRLTLGETGHDFVWRFANDTLDIAGVQIARRRFNEDVPGKDEIYAKIAVHHPETGLRVSDEVRTNTVSGRF